MTFRWKLFLISLTALWLTIGLVAAGMTFATRRAFADLNARQSDALVTQFRREFGRRSQEVSQQIKSIADAESTVRMAIDLSRPQADVSIYAHDATGVSQQHQLDLLDFVASDGSIISSAESPDRIGAKLNWVAEPRDWSATGPFLMRADTESGPALALMYVAAVRVGEKDLFVAGGERLGKEFVASVSLPTGMRALLYRNLDQGFASNDLLDSNGIADDADGFLPIITQELKQPSPQTVTINWTRDAATAEMFQVLPLTGRQKETLAVLLLGSVQSPIVLLERRIALLTVAAALGGLLFSALLSWWAAASVTKPVQQLVATAEQIARGDWPTQVRTGSNGEVGKLAQSFNRMTGQLLEQRHKLVQSERVAAWREVTQRLAQELKDPLIPIQATVENLRRIHNQSPQQFDEMFVQSADTLIAEIENLKNVIERFGNFATMPQPELQTVNLNDLIRAVLKLYEGQFGAVGRPPITPELHLEDGLPLIQGDPVLLQRAFENLVLNAMDAMPSGGMIAVTTSKSTGGVQLEISDTGSGLTPEECARLFTPYYANKQHGTVLGLAIVQSIVSDHGGTIAVESEKGIGTTFRIDLPNRPPKRAPVVIEPAAVPVHQEA